ncbi:MAG: hypothetical protein V4857_11010 [Pseudomonadota bacterium]
MPAVVTDEEGALAGGFNHGPGIAGYGIRKDGDPQAALCDFYDCDHEQFRKRGPSQIPKNQADFPSVKRRHFCQWQK